MAKKTKVVDKKYQAVIILGTKPNTRTWSFPLYLYEGLKQAKKAVDNGTAPVIIVSGDQNTAIYDNNIEQPYKEADKLAEILIKMGVPADKIIKETKSRDTLSKLYFIKTGILIPKKINSVLFVTPSFKAKRLNYLIDKILGPDYNVTIKKTSTKRPMSYNEMLKYRVHKKFLASMKPGDHKWLDGKFYDDPMYAFWTQYNRRKKFYRNH